MTRKMMRVRMSILLGKELIALSICVLTALGLLLIAVGYYGRAKLKKTAAPKKRVAS